MMAVFRLRYDRWGCALVFDRTAGSLGAQLRDEWFADEVSDTIRSVREALQAPLPKCSCGGQFARTGTVAACIQCGTTIFPTATGGPMTDVIVGTRIDPTRSSRQQRP